MEENQSERPFELQDDNKVRQATFTNAIRSDFHGPLNYSATKLFQAVYQALDKGLHYNTDVDQYVKNYLKNILTDEVINAQYTNTAVEGGRFGMHIYYMRKVIQKWEQRIANRRAIEEYPYQNGVKLKNFCSNGQKYSTALICSIDRIEGFITLICSKRGTSNKWQLKLDASDQSLVKQLIESNPLTQRQYTPRSGVVESNPSNRTNLSLF